MDIKATGRPGKSRAGEILAILARKYPDAKIALNYKSSWELLVAVILSAQCTDIIVNRVTLKLFSKYRTLEAYIKASPGEFEDDIRSTGFFRNKARNILSSARLIRDRFNGKVPCTMGELTGLPGVARKTANIVLGNAFGTVVGIAVDTHVARISQRLRLVDFKKTGGKVKVTFVKNGEKAVDFFKDANTDKIESELMTVVPKTEWFKFTYRIIDHGRSICKARNPLCKSCPLNRLCEASRM